MKKTWLNLFAFLGIDVKSVQTSPDGIFTKEADVDKMAELPERLKAAEDAKTAAEQALADAKAAAGDVAGLEAKIAALTNEKQQLANQLAALTKEKEDLTAQVATLEAALEGKGAEGIEVKRSGDEGAEDASKDLNASEHSAEIKALFPGFKGFNATPTN